MRFLTALLLYSLLLLLLIAAYRHNSSFSLASGNLLDAQDQINDDQELADSVEHVISFTLPMNSIMINANDAIFISMPNFRNVTLPIRMSGSYLGTPEFSFENDKIKITGIAILPGNNVAIEGLKASNPQFKHLYQVTIIVAENGNVDLIKNIANFLASKSSGTVSVTASIAPPLSSLVISGYSAPGTFITFMENGTILGTDNASFNLGIFSKIFTGLSPDTHHISLFGIDTNNLTTSPVDLVIPLQTYQQTTVANQILSPTIQIDKTEVVQGTPLVVQGSTIPSGDVSMFVESPLHSYFATASATGNWSYTITNTNTYVPGDYRIYSMVQNKTGIQSTFSTSLQFSVIPVGGSSQPPASCNITHGDLSCDLHVNLTDFSILMYYWGTNSTAADMNQDNRVNLTDFSIMMYYWGT